MLHVFLPLNQLIIEDLRMDINMHLIISALNYLINTLYIYLNKLTTHY